jgi:hypothetical protein
VLEQQIAELHGHGDVAIGRLGLGSHAVSGVVYACACELGAQGDDAGGEIDVCPDQPEQLGDPQAGVEGRGDHQPVRFRASVQQAFDVRASEYLLASREWAWTLVALELADRIDGRPAPPACVVKDAMKCRQRSSGRLGGELPLVQRLK